mmetsp:Transcript_38500/g.71119  ORF Transcript_38500/g.71119 Transcript_38500/m.71119 type:complete len:205 (-) Transcript_38500:682-1296(-)
MGTDSPVQDRVPEQERGRVGAVRRGLQSHAARPLRPGGSRRRQRRDHGRTVRGRGGGPACPVRGGQPRFHPPAHRGRAHGRTLGRGDGRIVPRRPRRRGPVRPIEGPSAAPPPSLPDVLRRSGVPEEQPRPVSAAGRVGTVRQEERRNVSDRTSESVRFGRAGIDLGRRTGDVRDRDARDRSVLRGGSSVAEGGEGEAEGVEGG